MKLLRRISLSNQSLLIQEDFFHKIERLYVTLDTPLDEITYNVGNNNDSINLLSRKRLIELYKSNYQSFYNSIVNSNEEVYGDKNKCFITIKSLEKIRKLYHSYNKNKKERNIIELENIWFKKNLDFFAKQNQKDSFLKEIHSLRDSYFENKVEKVPDFSTLSIFELMFKYNREAVYKHSLHAYHKKKEKKIITDPWATDTTSTSLSNKFVKIKDVKIEPFQKLLKEYKKEKIKKLRDRPRPTFRGFDKYHTLNITLINMYSYLARARRASTSFLLYKQMMKRHYAYEDYLIYLAQSLTNSEDRKELHPYFEEFYLKKKRKRRKYSFLYSRKKPIDLKDYTIYECGPYPDVKLRSRFPKKNMPHLVYISKELEKSIKLEQSFKKTIKEKKKYKTKRKKLLSKTKYWL